MTTRRLGLGLKFEFCQLFISNKIFPNRFVGVDFLNSRLCCLVKVLYSFDVRRFSNTVSGVNVTWRRIRARSNPESLISESDLEWLISGEFLISSESDLDEFVLEEVVSPSDANDEGLESLVVVSLEANHILTSINCTCKLNIIPNSMKTRRLV